VVSKLITDAHIGGGSDCAPALAIAPAAAERARAFLYSSWPVARVTPFENNPAHDQSEQAMYELRFPAHDRFDVNSRSRLCSPLEVKAKNKQSRRVELLMNLERRHAAKSAVGPAHQTKVVAFSHLGAKLFVVKIRSRSHNKERLVSVFRHDRYLSIQSPNADIEAPAVDFIYGAAKSSPPEFGDLSSVNFENVASPAVTLSADNYLSRTHEVTFELLAGGGTKNFNTRLHDIGLSSPQK